MTLISLKTENFRADGAIKAEFSDGSSLLFSTSYLPEAVLPDKEELLGLFEPDREISPYEENAFRFAAACYQAERVALRLVARAEQNSFGLAAKLERRHFDAAVSKAVVSCLLGRNLLDDARYAEIWVRSHLSSRKAPTPQWLLASLRRRGIDRDSSLKALNKTIDSETEYEMLLKYLEKTRFSRDKRAFYLRSQLKQEGFSSEAINRYLDEFPF